MLLPEKNLSPKTARNLLLSLVAPTMIKLLTNNVMHCAYNVFFLDRHPSLCRSESKLELFCLV